MKKEILILGIIFLFIGIGVQPAFAVEISNDKTSENIEDCGCEVKDNYDIKKIERLLNRAERLLHRVETLTKLIPIFAKDNPEVIKDFEELSEKIDTFKEIYEELKTNWDYPIICTILENIELLLDLIGDNIWDIIHKYEDTNPVIANFIWLFILGPVAVLIGLTSHIGYRLDCDW